MPVLPTGRARWFGLALAVGFGTFQLSATILPANVPNLVMSGAAEGSYGIHLNYVPYLLLHARARYSQRVDSDWFNLLVIPRQPEAAGDLAPAEPMGRDEKRLAAACGGIGNVGDGELARCGAAWTGLAASVIVMLPRVGFITGEEFSAGVNMRTCIYVAGILGLAIVVTQTGIGPAVGRRC